MRVKKKMEAGAEFFLTQPVFSKEDAERVRRIKKETGTRILCGIMPFVNKRNALFMKNEIAGIIVPDEVIARYPENGTKQEGEAVGVEIAVKLWNLLLILQMVTIFLFLLTESIYWNRFCDNVANV